MKLTKKQIRQSGKAIKKSLADNPGFELFNRPMKQPVTKFVKIKPEWCDSLEEQNDIFEVLSVPNSNNRIDIRPVRTEKHKNMTFLPIESIDIKRVIFLHIEQGQCISEAELQIENRLLKSQRN